MLESFSRSPSEMNLFITIWGKWNPAIFQPYWMVRHNLVGETEVDDDANIIVHNSVTSLRLNYCKFKANPQQITLETDQLAYFNQTSDLLNGIIVVLKSIPVSAMEFSVYTHFELESRNEVDAFFRKIAPNDFWINTIDRFEYSNVKVKKQLDGAYSNNATISISPCPKSKKMLHLNIDNKFDFSSMEFIAVDLRSIINEQMIASFNYCIKTINDISNEF